jgi:NAD-dependent dihydropyrimidine dehydrogenase PreA subunit
MKTRTPTFHVAAGLLAAIPPETPRFPSPEFDSGYVLPTPAHPHSLEGGLAWVDMAVLLGALGLATYLVLVRRRRSEVFLLLMASLVYFGFIRSGCVCSVGSLQNMTLALFNPAAAAPVRVVVFFLAPLAFALLFGRTFCAAVCPLGALQDAVVLWPMRLPPWLAGMLAMLARVYLAAAVLFAATGAAFVVCRYDPFVSLFRLSGTPVMVGAGFLLLGLGTVVARPYCRFLCPYGVLLSWASRLSRWHVSISPDECVDCRLCRDACPVGAIVEPTDVRAPPSRRRMALLLVCFPALLLGGGFLASRAAVPLAGVHRTVALCAQIAGEQRGEAEPTDASEAFRASDKTPDELRAAAADIRGRFVFGGWLAGIFIAAAFAVRLFGLLRQPRRDTFEPDRGECLSCARCFDSCPQEHKARKQRREA